MNLSQEEQVEQLETSRKRVVRHVDTVLSTAETERYNDSLPELAASDMEPVVLDQDAPDPAPERVAGPRGLVDTPTDERSIDPDRDLLPGFADGLRAGDPELRKAVRDLALGFDLVVRLLVPIVRRSWPVVSVIVLVSSLLVLSGALGGVVAVLASGARW